MDDDELADLRAREIGFIFSLILMLVMTVVEDIRASTIYAGNVSAHNDEADQCQIPISGVCRPNEAPTLELSGGQQQRAGNCH